MKSVSVFFGLVFCVVLSAEGQLKPDSLSHRKRIAYYFSLQSGALMNEKQVTSSFATTHGVKIGNRLRVGGGVGFDSYEQWNTMPMTGNVSFDLFGKRNVVFTQFNYGWAKAWKISPQEYGLTDERGGRAFSAMLGYRINYGDVRLALMAGYKYQRVTSYYEYSIWSWAWGDPFAPKGSESTSTETIEQTMKRFAISLMVGWK
jgi:hypothetical protein